MATNSTSSRWGSEEARMLGRRARTKYTATERNSEGERKRIIEDTTERIKTLLANEGLNYKQLAAMLDMTPAHVSHLMTGNRNMTLGTLADIGEVIGYRFTIIPSPLNHE